MAEISDVPLEKLTEASRVVLTTEPRLSSQSERATACATAGSAEAELTRKLPAVANVANA